jgi:phosphatidate cytidylyltransferase
MLGLRVITAAVLVAFIIPTLVYGGVAGVALLVAVFSTAAIWELSGNLAGVKPGASRFLTVLLGLGIVAACSAWSFPAVFALIAGLPLGILAIHLLLFHRIESTVDSAAHMTFALGYTVIPLAHAVLLSRLAFGTVWVFFVLVVVCLADAGAYFVGKAYGKTRLAPGVSPGKTVEGLAGSLAGGMLGMTAMKVIVPGLPSLGVLFSLALLLVLADVVGDLCASALKRRLGVKDFGASLPGHGGVLDRADSLIFAYPTAFHFLMLTGSAVLL